MCESLERLYPRERAVVGLMAKGKSNKQIAADLELSEATVKGYAAAAMHSLGVPNRAGATAIWVACPHRDRDPEIDPPQAAGAK